MNDDLISRQAAIDELSYCQTYLFDSRDDDKKISLEDAEYAIEQLPSAQPEDWVERNKERILQAGMEGREVEFYIGGRLFAIREIAQ